MAPDFSERIRAFCRRSRADAAAAIHIAAASRRSACIASAFSFRTTYGVDGSGLELSM